MSVLYRLEYLTPDGWWVGHAGIALLNPQRYVDGLAAKRKFGRATELDDRLQPTGKVYAPDDLPDPAKLRPSDTRIPYLPKAELMCRWCDAYHRGPFDGACLL